MTVIAIIPVLFAIVGLLLFVLASNDKVSEVGRLMFFAGLLVTMFVVAKQTVKL